MQRLTVIYLRTYLLLGGVGLLLAPEIAPRLLLSNGAYGDVMPRVAGMFMIVVSGFIGQFVKRSDYTYYGYTVLARSFIVIVFTALYWKTRDPLFLVLDGIVLLGLVPSAYVFLTAENA